MSTLVAGASILACWLTLTGCGRWRVARDPIGILGVLVGISWIAIAAVDAFDVALRIN